MLIEILAFSHLIGFLLARIGTIHQLFIIWNSKRHNPSGLGLNTRCLSLKYRVAATLLFFSFLWWGTSSQPLDWVVIISNSFSLVLFVVLIYELYIDQRNIRAKYWLIFYLFLLSLTGWTILFHWSSFKALNSFFGLLTVIFSLNLALFSWDKVFKIVKAKSPGKQSLIEMLFQLVKDVTGLAYGFFLGWQHGWPLVIAFISLAVVRIFNIAVYLHYSAFWEHFFLPK